MNTHPGAARRRVEGESEIVPAVSTVVPEHTVVLSVGWGALTGPDLIASTRVLAANPQFRPDYRQLMDLRAVTLPTVDGRDMQQIAAANPFLPEALRAIVVSSDMTFGLARMYQMLRNGPVETLHVCRDVDEAFEWLGLVAEKPPLIALLASLMPAT